MSTDGRGSITHWIGALKAGEHAAAQALWERYFDRLVHRARAQLRALGRQGGDSDEEDAALSAFDSFCAGMARDRFPQLDDRDDLWRLLVALVARKVVDQARHRRRQKRGGGRVLDEAALGGPDTGAGPTALDALIGPEPTPAFAALVAEEYRRLLEGLGDETLRRIALRKMEGYTLEEIAAELGCARRTVVNKLHLIRVHWERTS
jgi:DNA-directed RNA polymerase specialized sigma24 family protein